MHASIEYKLVTVICHDLKKSRGMDAIRAPTLPLRFSECVFPCHCVVSITKKIKAQEIKILDTMVQYIFFNLLK